MKESLQTLADLYLKGTTQKGCTIGILTDCSAPYRSRDSTDWIVRAKIIDQTLNDESAIGEQGNRYCLVFFFASKASELPRPTQIGSILYLRRADFDFWQANKFKAKLGGKKYTSWILFSGDPSRLDLGQLQTNREDLGAEDRFGLRSSLVELRAFSFNYFREHSLQMISYHEESSDFDFIFKVMECEPSFNRYKLSLSDGHEKYRFYSDVQFAEEQVVKVRSIARVEWSDEPLLKPNDYTWIMRVPNWMASFKEGGVVSIERLRQPFVEQPSIINLQQPLSTIISELSKELPISSFVELIKQPIKCQRKRVKCWVTDIPIENYSDGLRKMSANRLVGWGTQHQGTNIYQMPIQLQDCSLEQQRGCFLAYLLSFDGQGDNFFDGINPKHIYGLNVTAQEEAFRKFKNDLIEQSCKENELEMVVECLCKGDKSIWRIVETKLLDFI